MLYNFYLFPCLNPDGVEGGFYRTNLSGFDLNRTWLTPHKLLHSSIFIIKDFLFSKSQNVVLFVDLHGHSKKRNVFMYGNPTASNEGLLSWTKVRLFPRIIA